jgi:hypothetical protein
MPLLPMMMSPSLLLPLLPLSSVLCLQLLPHLLPFLLLFPSSLLFPRVPLPSPPSHLLLSSPPPPPPPLPPPPLPLPPPPPPPPLFPSLPLLCVVSPAKE